jgi:hypothetical protein
MDQKGQTPWPLAEWHEFGLDTCEMIDKPGAKSNSNLLCCSIVGEADVATPKLVVDEAGFSKEQLDLIQKFEADFNTVFSSQRSRQR